MPHPQEKGLYAVPKPHAVLCLSTFVKQIDDIVAVAVLCCGLRVDACLGPVKADRKYVEQSKIARRIAVEKALTELVPDDCTLQPVRCGG